MSINEIQYSMKVMYSMKACNTIKYYNDTMCNTIEMQCNTMSILLMCQCLLMSTMSNTMNQYINVCVMQYWNTNAMIQRKQW